MPIQDSSSTSQNKNAFDAVGTWFKSLFSRSSSSAAGSEAQLEGEIGGRVAQAGPVVVSAVPARLQGKGEASSSSAPPSPGLKRSKDGSGSKLSVPSPNAHQRVLSAPEHQRGALQSSGSLPVVYGENSPPPIFGFLVPLIEQYSPAVVPYVDKAQELYAEFRDSDQRTHYVYHIGIVIVLLYLLSSLLIFAFKLLVFTILMFSTGWTVHTSEWFNSNEVLKRYAFGATGLIGLYLFILMN